MATKFLSKIDLDVLEGLLDLNATGSLPADLALDHVPALLAEVRLHRANLLTLERTLERRPEKASAIDLVRAARAGRRIEELVPGLLYCWACAKPFLRLAPGTGLGSILNASSVERIDDGPAVKDGDRLECLLCGAEWRHVLSHPSDGKNYVTRKN
jgi:hypothetical protein